MLFTRPEIFVEEGFPLAWNIDDIQGAHFVNTIVLDFIFLESDKVIVLIIENQGPRANKVEGSLVLQDHVFLDIPLKILELHLRIQIYGSVKGIHINVDALVHEEANAVAFFLSHARERDHEVELYVALKDIDFFGGSNDLWIKTYEKAVKKGVKPRDRLVEEYEERKGK